MVTCQSFLVFTDGSYQPKQDVPAGEGGVLVFECSGRLVVCAFGVAVPKALLEEWEGSGKRHLIGQVEMYALWLRAIIGLNTLMTSVQCSISTTGACKVQPLMASPAKLRGGNSLFFLSRFILTVRALLGMRKLHRSRTSLMGLRVANGSSFFRPFLSA